MSTENLRKSFAARAAPAIFVLLWSTGFIGTKYGCPMPSR